MNFPSRQFITSGGMDMYEPLHQINSWGDFNGHGCTSTSAFEGPGVDAELDSQSENTLHGILAPSGKYDQEATNNDKIKRRLAQNREAARKSRLRKKAYVQQLEISRSKLIQLEQELVQARQQGMYLGEGLEGSPLELSATNSGINPFEMEYKHWLEEQNRHISELRNALNGHISDIELHMLVDSGMNHYFELFRMKATAAESDIIYLMSGMWKTPAERIFTWIGGFRPSDILKVIVPQLELLTDQQLFHVCSLKDSCQQTEDALSQGMDRLQQTLTETVAVGLLSEGSYIPQMAAAMEKFEALVGFTNQADKLRQGTLQQMMDILTVRQAARGLLALGEYFHRLRVLSDLWATRQCKPA